jgi:alpha-ketoglutarate-dependent taurine dioxygenase
VPRIPQIGEEEVIERDGEEVTVRTFKHPNAPDGEDQLTTLETTRPARAHLHEDRLSLTTDKERLVYFPYYYLRDLCKCPQCVDPHSNQRSFRTHDIRRSIHPRRVTWDGKDLEIQWNNDIQGYDREHTSRWPYHYLRKPIINTHDTGHPHMSPFRWNAATMEKYQHWISYEDYMHSEKKFTAAMQNLARLGLIFVKDIPSSREMVEKIATRMGPLRNSFYGSTWDVRTVPEAKNVAYTNQHLGFHMDLLYMNEPPGYQLLHCLENSCEGGESLFADAFNVADRMKRTHKKDYKTLTTRHIGYEYVHEDAIYHNTWPVFELDPKTHQLRNVNYSPPFQSAIPTWKQPDGKGQGFSGYGSFKQAMHNFAYDLESKDSVFQLKLNPGECVIFANRRVVHARNKFNTTNGSRWLAGAYVDQDAVLSRFAVVKRNDLKSWVASDPGVVSKFMPNQAQTESSE